MDNRSHLRFTFPEPIPQLDDHPITLPKENPLINEFVRILVKIERLKKELDNLQKELNNLQEKPKSSFIRELKGIIPEPLTDKEFSLLFSGTEENFSEQIKNIKLELYNELAYFIMLVTSAIETEDLERVEAEKKLNDILQDKITLFESLQKELSESKEQKIEQTYYSSSSSPVLFRQIIKNNEEEKKEQIEQERRCQFTLGSNE